MRVNFPTLRRRAFTLIEMLISVALLAVLAALIFLITSAASGTIRISNRAIDAAAQARLAFDRIGLDLSSAVNDGQTDFTSVNAAPGSTNLIEFVSGVTSAGTVAGGNRGVSVVAYQLNTHVENKNRVCLVRASKPVGWNVAGFRGIQTNGIPMSFTNAAFPAVLVPSASSDYDILAPGVIRMVVGYQLYPDNEPAELQDGTSIPNARGQIVYSPPIRVITPKGGGTAEKMLDLNRISAVVVGLVAVDLETLRSLDAGAVQTLSDAFAGIPETNQLPTIKWMADTSNLTALSTDIPLPARQAVRLYQRTFPVTPYTSKVL